MRHSPVHIVVSSERAVWVGCEVACPKGACSIGQVQGHAGFSEAGRTAQQGTSILHKLSQKANLTECGRYLRHSLIASLVSGVPIYKFINGAVHGVSQQMTRGCPILL